MASRHHKDKHYAVVCGRVDEPTIVPSWAHAHPRVTGCPSEHKSFLTIEDARLYMKSKGVMEPKEVIKDKAGKTTSLGDGQTFFAVAHGKQPGIYLNWYETEREVKGFPDACYQRFGTRAEAEGFIEDWKESFADVWRRAIREGLDQGLRPCDMRLGLEGILCGTEVKVESSDILDLGRLVLEEE